MTTKKLKEKYLKFFESKGHKIIPGASLIPENDPSTLFISAGMHPLVPYLLGEKHPAGKRLVNNQKCERTNDIEEVGDDIHLTFFEMLGNWSLGDYWKKEAIEWSFEFLTSKEWLGLDKSKISISCFKGDPSTDSTNSLQASSGQVIPKDTESARIWQSVGIPKNRIKFLGRKENWWGPAGETGPCGPDTEIFYDGIEIWNNVFMEYNKKLKTQNSKRKTYEYVPLKQKNVDTGMGVERTVAVLNGKKSVFDIEPLKSIIEKVRELGSKKDLKSERIITDHLRTAVFILADGIAPSNLGQGYVLRRLIRRAIRYGKKLGIDKPFTFKIAEVVIEKMGDEYPELKKNKDFIIEQSVQEEERFNKTLEKGLKEFKKISKDIYGERSRTISGHDAFILFSTYGFPLEITKELAQEKGLKVDERRFQEEFKKHQKLSRTAAAGRFKGGLASNSEKITKLHTATHLLLAALRQILGNHVYQKGSNITAERLRLDFSHPEKMLPEEIRKVENIVNEQIKKDLPVSCEEMSLTKAKKIKAMGIFETKYGNRVKVYTIGKPDNPFSREICGGPHVKSTGQLNHFRITKEQSSSAGIRRIKAILE